MKNHYVRQNNLLAMYNQRADSGFWESHWTDISDKQLRRVLRPTGTLGPFIFFFPKWLPRDGVVLEAGCGRGHWVRRLRAHGYNCIGLDYAQKSLERSKQVVDELPLLAGDIFRMPFQDESLAAYISFGVVEHYEDGPGHALAEAYRVLRPGGVALISVPFENRIRKTITGISKEKALEQGLEFYQYYFTFESLAEYMRKSGFDVKPCLLGYDVYMGLRALNPMLGGLMKKLPLKSVWGAALDYICPLSRNYGHMIFAVGIK